MAPTAAQQDENPFDAFMKNVGGWWSEMMPPEKPTTPSETTVANGKPSPPKPTGEGMVPPKPPPRRSSSQADRSGETSPLSPLSTESEASLAALTAESKAQAAALPPPPPPRRSSESTPPSPSPVSSPPPPPRRSSDAAVDAKVEAAVAKVEAKAAEDLAAVEDEWSTKLGEYISRNAQLRVEVKQATRRSAEAEKALEAAHAKMAELQKAAAEQTAALAKSNQRVKELEQRLKASNAYSSPKANGGGDFPPAFSDAVPMASPEYDNYLEALEQEETVRTFSPADEERALRQIDAKASPGGHFSTAPDGREAILASLNAANGGDAEMTPKSRNGTPKGPVVPREPAINEPKDTSVGKKQPAAKSGRFSLRRLTGSKSSSSLKYPKGLD